jgi:hypothetical protein
VPIQTQSQTRTPTLLRCLPRRRAPGRARGLAPARRRRRRCRGSSSPRAPAQQGRRTASTPKPPALELLRQPQRPCRPPSYSICRRSHALGHSGLRLARRCGKPPACCSLYIGARAHAAPRGTGRDGDDSFGCETYRKARAIMWAWASVVGERSWSGGAWYCAKKATNFAGWVSARSGCDDGVR